MENNELKQMIESDCLTEQEKEFFESAENTKFYRKKDGFDYLSYTFSGNNLIISVSKTPIYGDDTYETSDINARDISVDDAIEYVKNKYNNKNIKVKYLSL